MRWTQQAHPHSPIGLGSIKKSVCSPICSSRNGKRASACLVMSSILVNLVRKRGHSSHLTLFAAYSPLVKEVLNNHIHIPALNRSVLHFNRIFVSPHSPKTSSFLRPCGHRKMKREAGRWCHDYRAS